MTPFELKETIPTDHGIQALVTIDPKDAIYKAHFPGHPVTPGVCLIQAVSELMEQHYGRKLMICNLKNVRFLSAIIPDKTQTVLFDIQCGYQTDTDEQSRDTRISCKATISKNGTPCAKMSLVFEPID